MCKVYDAYDYCESIIAENSKTFYKAFSFLPAMDRKAIWAVYTFCRTVDDIVDEGEHPHVELKEFQSQFNKFLHGIYDDNNLMWVALADVFSRYDMDIEPFHALIKGQEMDLVKNRYETMEELLNYCFHVASTVGLMLLPILAPSKVEQLKEGAISLGLAMQITNILRDVGEDFNRGRIYLPKEIMDRHGLSVEAFSTKTIDAPFIYVWENLALKAESLYDKALETLEEYPRRSRIPVKLAATFYREILTAVRDKDYNVFNEKHFVSDDSKKQILANI